MDSSKHQPISIDGRLTPNPQWHALKPILWLAYHSHRQPEQSLDYGVLQNGYGRWPGQVS
jgi:hypothetical protein